MWTNFNFFFFQPTTSDFSDILLPKIIPLLCSNLLKQEDNTENEDEWNIASASAACITILAECTGDAILPIISPFIQLIKSDKWRQREASTMALGSILKGPTSQDMKNMSVEVLGILRQHLVSDSSDCVRATSGWAISRIAILQPFAICSDNEIIPSLLSMFSYYDPIVAYYSCYVCITNNYYLKNYLFIIIRLY